MCQHATWGSLLKELLEVNEEEVSAVLEEVNADYSRGEKIYPAVESIFEGFKRVPLQDCRVVVVGGNCLNDLVAKAMKSVAGKEWRERMQQLGIINIYEHLTVTKYRQHNWSYIINILLAAISKHNKNCSFIFVGTENWYRSAFVVGKERVLKKIAAESDCELEDCLEQESANGLCRQHVGDP